MYFCVLPPALNDAVVAAATSGLGILEILPVSLTMRVRAMPPIWRMARAIAFRLDLAIQGTERAIHAFQILVVRPKSCTAKPYFFRGQLVVAVDPPDDFARGHAGDAGCVPSEPEDEPVGCVFGASIKKIEERRDKTGRIDSGDSGQISAPGDLASRVK